MTVEGAAAGASGGADRVATNRSNWDSRVPIHLDSQTYAVDEFRRTRRSRIGAIECAELGELGGRRLLHLQCHIGTDTLSLALLGAEVTGVDFSVPAIEAAQSLAASMNLGARFIVGEVQGLDLSERFDIVFASRGVLCWIEDIDAWMATAARHLAPGGLLYLFDGHPLAEGLQSIDDEGRTVLAAGYRYLDAAAERSSWPHTYTDGAVELSQPVTYQWRHALSAVVTAAASAGLRIESLAEHAEDFFQRHPIEQLHHDYWRVPGDPLPMTFSLRARAPA